MSAWCLLGVFAFAAPADQARAQAACAGWQAEFVSAKGEVEVQSGDENVWRSAAAGAVACRGDLIRVGPYSRAALRLPDKSIFRIDQNTQLRLPDADDTARTWVDLLRGIIHIISRDPRELGFSTPFMNAGLEGTEFVLSVGDAGAEVTVLEGIVALDSGPETIQVLPGQRGSAGPATPPRAAPVADPFSATRWTPYSARILTDLAELPPSGAPVTDGTAIALVRRAASRLQHGAFAAAAADLERAAAADPAHPGVPAHRVMLALSRGDKLEANASADAAATLGPDYAPAWVARSYAEQAGFDYAAALASARKARALAADSAVAASRLAELELANGDHRAAMAAANAALELAPDYGPAHSARAFALLAAADMRASIDGFRTAIDLDSESPVPRFGLALALLRDGQQPEGRDQLEIAVVLDPTNAAVRSLMAKIYADEGRIELAGSQLELARALDAADATPLLYRALTEQRANRPVAALQAFDDAAQLNDAAPVFRTNLRLDSDSAVREFGFGGLYRDLGFQAWALREGWRATERQPADYAGHQLLSDAYAYLPRHEVARVNEHYSARLLQPLSQNPVAPQLAEQNLFLLDDLGPSPLGSSEFVGLVRSNGIRMRASGVSAGLDTRGYEVAMTGLRDGLAYGFGHMDFATDGLRTNNDLAQEVTSGFVQLQPNPSTNLLAEFRTSQSDQGSLQLLFDPTSYSPALRLEEAIDSVRLGLRQSVGAGEFLVSANLQDATYELRTGPAYALDLDADIASLEVQHLLAFGRWRLTNGFYRTDQRADSLTRLSFALPGAPPGFPPVITEIRESEPADELSVYSYASVDLGRRLEATLGLAADRLAVGDDTAYDTNPKLGLRFVATERTTLRAALTAVTLGRIVSRRFIQPRLEPTHVVGFNQLLTGSQGEHAWRFGTALDHRLSRNVLTGIEIAVREADWETLLVDPFGNQLKDHVARKELLQHVYLQWMPNLSWSLSAAYQRERFDIDGLSLVEGFAELDTRRLPIEVHYFPTNGLSAQARLSYVRQSGTFTQGAFDAMFPALAPGSDRFAVLDLAMAYRLPRGRGQIMLTIDNALDADFRFQDIDPENPNIIPARVVALRFTVQQ